MVVRPRGCRVIKNHWVFDVKPDGRKRACLVAKGVMIFAGFSPFPSKSQAPTHSTSLNHDIFPHSLSYLISCPISLILSFIFFRSFRLEGKLGHLGLLGLETFGPWEDEHRTIYCGAMSNCSPTKESTQVVTMELILSWTSSQVNSGLG